MNALGHLTYFATTPGIRRTVKVYGPLRDPKAEARRRREAGRPIGKPHSGIVTSVKDQILGQIPPLLDVVERCIVAGVPEKKMRPRRRKL